MASAWRSAAALVVPLVLLAEARSLAAEPASSGGLQTALARAGDNKTQLVTALEKVAASRSEGMQFLIANMPRRDLEALSAEFLLENTDLAYRAMQDAPWAGQVPKEIFLNYVLPYANVNERRDAWRKDFYDRFLPVVKDCKTPAEAAERLNRSIFKELEVKYSRKRLKPDQSPYESMESGLASCTGLSILLVDACRAVGVPARFVGTPLWADRSGNHTWVEVWDRGWHFTGAAEPSPNGLDHAWFVRRASQAKHDPPIHAIYAVSYKRTPLKFPLVWNRRADYVHAVDVTDRYTRRKEPLDPKQTRLSIRVFDRKGGERVAARVRILSAEDGSAVFQGTTKDERVDFNDHLIAEVLVDKEYRLELRHQNKYLRKTFRPTQQEMLLTFYTSDGQELQPTRFALTPEGSKFIESPSGRRIAARLKAFFDAPPEERSKVVLDAQWDELLLKYPKAIRKMTWDAYRSGYAPRKLAEDFQAHRVTFQEHVSPYVVRKVGSMPERGWPLLIAMHGGGGAPKRVNDSQWRVMQRYYRDQDEVEGYLYLALRAPNDKWNGFYDWYNLPLTANLIRQFLLLENVDPSKVFIMGYSHGGYGPFYIGTKMADRFAAVHVSAAAPTDGHAPAKNLRNTVFTYMVGEHDTRYGRLKRCQRFNERIRQLRGDRTDVFPVTMEYKPGYGHSGLPDRDKIKDIYPAKRNPLPRHVTWELTDGTV
ncbi:MAG: transglutaminase domain-containing protein, partial [Planctomycetota bacterium]